MFCVRCKEWIKESTWVEDRVGNWHRDCYEDATIEEAMPYG